MDIEPVTICVRCKHPQTRAYYSKTQWNKIVGNTCKACMEDKTIKGTFNCCRCKKSLDANMFSKNQLKRGNNAKCSSCVEESLMRMVKEVNEEPNHMDEEAPPLISDPLENTLDDVCDIDLDDFEMVEDSITPLFTIYYNSSEQLEAAMKEVTALEKLLLELNVKAGEIQKVNLVNDYELKCLIKLDSLAVLFCMRKKLGDLNVVTKLRDSGQLKTDIESARKGDPGLSNLEIGILDRTLEGVETIVSYLNPLSWIRSGWSKKEGKEGQEFDVIHTNWYWRQLRRKFKFCNESFLRIHPRFGDIRASHEYSDISKIEIQGEDSLALTYNNNTSPDWIRCSPKDLVAIIKIIKQNKPDIQITY